MDTDNIDLAIEELAASFGDELTPDAERGAIRLAVLDLADDFAFLPLRSAA